MTQGYVRRVAPSHNVDVPGLMWLAVLVLVFASGPCSGQAASFEWQSFQLRNGQQFTGVDPLGVAIGYSNAADTLACPGSVLCIDNPQVTCPDTGAPTTGRVSGLRHLHSRAHLLGLCLDWGLR
jgi:hypothetical protein